LLQRGSQSAKGAGPKGETKHEGVVVGETDTEYLVDIGYKSEAILRKTELAPFREEVKEGEELEVLVTYIDEENGTVPQGIPQVHGGKEEGRAFCIP